MRRLSCEAGLSPTGNQLNGLDFIRTIVGPSIRGGPPTVAMINNLQATGMFQSVGLFDGHVAPECIMTGTIEHLEEVDKGKSVAIDVRVSARLSDFQTGEILWHGSASNDAVVEQRSVDAVVSQLSLGLGSAVQGLASSMQDHLRSLPPHTSRQAQPTSGNYP